MKKIKIVNIIKMVILIVILFSIFLNFKFYYILSSLLEEKEKIENMLQNNTILLKKSEEDKREKIYNLIKNSKAAEKKPQISNTEMPYYKNRVSQFEILPNKKNQIIFVGDSITDGCEWNELFQNNSVKNRGISSDTTKGVLKRIEQINILKPKKVFIMIGVNDLGTKVSIEEIIKNYREIVKNIKEKSKKSGIIIQSILPVNENYVGNIKNNSVIKLNQEIKKMAEDEKLLFVDLYNLYLDKTGNMDMSFTYDGIHLNGKGYSLWRDNIEKLVKIKE